METCALACSETPVSHCTRIVPTVEAIASVCDEEAPLPQLPNVPTLDTNIDADCTGGVFSQMSGPAICVVRYKSIQIDQTLAVVGSRVLALVSDEDQTVGVSGTLDVSARGTVDGPGADVAAAGTESNPSPESPIGNFFGGGGAGAATAGEDGADMNVNGGKMNHGPAVANPATLEVLVGGQRPATASGGSRGGGGGGAAVLVACRGAVRVNGIVDAGGGGGEGGRDLDMTPGVVQFTSGGGGGAGGTVLIQGAAVSITGRVFANGGAGGGGAPVDNDSGASGEDATRSTTAARGGQKQPAGDGGVGATIMTMPGQGSRPAAGGATPGGGGGSFGFLSTFTPAGIFPTVAPQEASPTFDANRVLQTR